MQRIDMNFPSRYWALVDPLLIFLFTGGIYTYGACRTIYVGDSGELVAAAATLGIPHPSGYPLYVLLGHVWIQLLPLGSVAFRMSLFSAFFAAAACTLFFLTAQRAGATRPAVWIGTLLLAFSPSFWSQAGIQRVYSLTAFFVVAVIALAFEWYQDPERPRDVRWLAAAALVAGLGATNHTVLGVVGLAVGLFALAVEPGLLRRPVALAGTVTAGLLGLLPYAYLPLRSRQDPRLDWGDPETLDSFLDVILRRDFWHRAWYEGPADAVTIALDWLTSLGTELVWGGTALAIWAVLCGMKRWPVALPILVMLANLWAVGSHGSRSDLFIWHRYYIPSYLMAALLATWGAQLAWERWGRRALALFLLPALSLGLGWHNHDRSDYRIAEDFSRTLLEELPPGAHLAASDDNILFVLIYLHLVEGVRPDLNLIFQGVGKAALPPLRFDPEDDPLFFTHHPNWNLPEIELIPMGLAYQVVRAGERPPSTFPKVELEGAWDSAVPKDYLSQNLVGHFHFMRGIHFEESDWPAAQQEFSRAMTAAPRNDVQFFNLGLIYRRNGLSTRALAAFEKAAIINPRHIPSANPVRPADKVVELRQEVEQQQALERELGGGLDLRTAQGLRELAQRLEGRTRPTESFWTRGYVRRAEEMEAGVNTGLPKE